jgi:hypothetical protein
MAATGVSLPQRNLEGGTAGSRILLDSPQPIGHPARGLRLGRLFVGIRASVT